MIVMYRATAFSTKSGPVFHSRTWGHRLVTRRAEDHAFRVFAHPFPPNESAEPNTPQEEQPPGPAPAPHPTTPPHPLPPRGSDSCCRGRPSPPRGPRRNSMASCPEPRAHHRELGAGGACPSIGPPILCHRTTSSRQPPRSKPSPCAFPTSASPTDLRRSRRRTSAHSWYLIPIRRWGSTRQQFSSH